MARRDSGLLTIRGLTFNKIRDIIAYISIAVVVIIVIWFIAIRAIVAHNCNNYYTYDETIFGHWIHMDVGSTSSNCPQPYLQ